MACIRPRNTLWPIGKAFPAEQWTFRSPDQLLKLSEWHIKILSNHAGIWPEPFPAVSHMHFSWLTNASQVETPQSISIVSIDLPLLKTFHKVHWVRSVTGKAWFCLGAGWLLPIHAVRWGGQHNWSPLQESCPQVFYPWVKLLCSCIHYISYIAILLFQSSWQQSQYSCILQEILHWNLSIVLVGAYRHEKERKK